MDYSTNELIVSMKDFKTVLNIHPNLVTLFRAKQSSLF